MPSTLESLRWKAIKSSKGPPPQYGHIGIATVDHRAILIIGGHEDKRSFKEDIYEFNIGTNNFLPMCSPVFNLGRKEAMDKAAQHW